MAAEQNELVLALEQATLTNNRDFSSVPENQAMTRKQVMDIVSDNFYRIVRESPATVDTMAEVSTFFSTTEVSVFSEIIHRFNRGGNELSSSKSETNETIEQADTTLHTNIDSLTSSINVEYDSAISTNIVYSDNLEIQIETRATNTQALQDSYQTLSENVDTIYTDLESETTVTTEQKQQFKNEESNSLSTANVTHDTNASDATLLLSQEDNRDTQQFNFNSSNLNTIAVDETTHHGEKRSALSSDLKTLGNETLDDANNLNSLTNQNKNDENVLNASMNIMNTTHSTDAKTLSDAHTSHLQEKNDNHQAVQSVLGTTSTTVFNDTTRIDGATTQEQTRRVSSVNQLLSNLTSTLSSDITTLTKQLDIKGGNFTQHVEVDGVFYLGPFWRFREDPLSHDLHIEYFDVSTHNWIDVMPISVSTPV